MYNLEENELHGSGSNRQNDEIWRLIEAAPRAMVSKTYAYTNYTIQAEGQ